ncbi:DNA-directed RNA polymerase subunit delta [Bacillus thuringiensis]
MVEEMGQVVGVSEEEVNGKIGEFYRELKIDGGLINLGENGWGVRRW